WELYLAGARSSFLAGGGAVMQLQLSPSRDAVPLTRDYLRYEEERLAELETDQKRRPPDIRRAG
ncbi:MAG TPA: SAM-dependent methyltransferase, partial [Thermohalobaculum sp.]|nr:SAM-dependent methyltransferase [Thermohalobaculum sp.]